MSEPTDRIIEFPQDGRLWWVRWVDHYHLPHLGTASPAVEVLLSPLGEATEDFRRTPIDEIIQSLECSQVSRIFSGAIPRLVLGAVFRNGELVGYLPSQAKTFAFDLGNRPSSIHEVTDALDASPSWWKEAWPPYRVLNKKHYPLLSVGSFGFLDSKCVVLRSAEHTLLLPCHEVFRALYAPHTEIALALTSGPWPHQWNRVINREQTGVLADGRWQIVLRRGVPNAFIRTLANLTIAPAGIEAACTIYNQGLSKEGASALHATLPFETDRLRIKVRCIPLHRRPDKYLAVEILAVKWPGPKVEILHDRDNSGDGGLIQTPTPRPKPFSSGSPLSAPSQTPVPVQSTADPSGSSQPVCFSAPGFEWWDPPPLRKCTKLESFIYQGTITPSPEQGAEGGAPGNTTGGTTSFVRANFTAVERRQATHRFLEVIAMLDQLVVDKKIETWSAVALKSGSDTRGDYSVWRFPTVLRNDRNLPVWCAWSYLDRQTRTHRAALVCKISVGGCDVYWMETEIRPAEGGFRSLVFRSDQTIDVTPTILELLEVGARHKGVWPTDPSLASLRGIAAVHTWKHRYSLDAKGKRRLNASSAHSLIVRTASIRLDANAEDSAAFQQAS